jgi:type 1 glutamine amidotransferase
MRTVPALMAAAAALLLPVPGLPVLRAADTAAPKIRLLLVTGGHDYETNQFRQVFQDDPGVSVQAVAHPQAHAWFKAGAASGYDTIVLYDMWAEISPDSQKDLVDRLQEGKGLLALHHCLGSYQKWDEYARIVGGRYHLQKYTVDGVEKPGSTYKHDVRFKVRIAPGNHPVTQGLADFEILDETYGGFEVRPGVTPLLTTDEPTSGPTIGWTHTYGKARVVYLELGHDHAAYENPNYRRLVSQAIRWVSPR